MGRLADWVMRYRAGIVGFWGVVLVLGAVMAPRAVERLTFDFALPGQPAYETSQDILRQYDGGGEVPPIVLVGEGPGAASTVGRAVSAVQQSLPGTEVVMPGRRLVSEDGKVALALLFPTAVPGYDPYVAARPAVEGIVGRFSTGGVRVSAMDYLALSEGSTENDRGLLIEVLIGATGALVVLLAVFASFLALAPLVIAAVSILATFLALLGLTYATDVSFIVQFLVALIGLGVSLDFSLLLAMRWREELAAGRSNPDAVRRCVETAGRSVLLSGLTVAVSLATLIAVPVPFLRSIGLGGMLIPVFAVLTSLTLLPAVLSLLGPQLLWPRHAAVSPRSRFWERLAQLVLRRRWWVGAGCLALLLILAAPVLRLNLGSPPLVSVTAGEEARVVRVIDDAGLPLGAFRPNEVLTDGDPGPALQRLRDIRGVGAVADLGRGRALVLSEADPASDSGAAMLEAVRDVPGLRVGGGPALDADFVRATYVSGAWALVPLGVVTFLLLARALRSVWLPLKALALNVISIAAAFGVTVWIWQDGHGTQALFGVASTGVVTTWVPVAAFAFLFGLSMDYEVFILSRMREAYDQHGSTDRAVVDGIANTGRLVSSGALILVFAFVALATVPTVEVKILATTLALGIAIDALLVRGLLAPALVGLFGRVNWVLPDTVRRMLLISAEEEPNHVDSQQPSSS